MAVGLWARLLTCLLLTAEVEVDAAEVDASTIAADPTDKEEVEADDARTGTTFAFASEPPPLPSQYCALHINKAYICSSRYR